MGEMMMISVKHVGMVIICAFTSLTAVSSVIAANNLTVLDWSGYDDSHFFHNYVEKYDKAPDYSFFSDQEEAFSKVRSGFQADLVHPCLGDLVKWRRAGLIEPIDVSRIAQWDNVIPQLRKRVREDGKVWMVPFDWGNSALVYRTDKVPESDVGLDIFIDPDYKGRTSLPSVPNDAWGAAFLATGVHSWKHVSDEEFEQAADWLRRAAKNARFLWKTAGDVTRAIASGEIVAGWTWNQTWAKLKKEGHPVAMMRDPKKGVETWVCGYMHLKSGDADDKEVYDFLNALLNPQSGKYLIEAWGYAHSNQKSFEIASQVAVEAGGFTNLNAMVEDTFFQTPAPPKLKAKMNRVYARIKAGF